MSGAGPTGGPAAGDGRPRWLRPWHAWLLVPLTVVWGVGLYLAAEHGTQGLDGVSARPNVIGSFLVFLHLDTEHRGEEGWAWLGFGLAVPFLAMWVALIVGFARRALRGRGDHDRPAS